MRLSTILEQVYYTKFEEIPPCWVIEQYKSSENIRNGIAPNPNSKGMLSTTVVQGELGKVSNKQHCKFYGGVDHILVIISNKTLATTIKGMKRL